MAGDIDVHIYLGPHKWFQKKFDLETDLSFLDLVYEDDAERREIRIVDPRGVPIEPEQTAPATKRPETVYAFSSDYASVNEHVLTNFSGIIRRMNPKRLLLQNPPTQVVAQVERSFGVTKHRYKYPRIDTAALRAFDAGFSDSVVGQEAVKDRLLAAFYPLLKCQTRPVVAMFYGPSGVGKTETAKYVNELLGGKLMRKQFSMFHSDKFGDYIFGGSHSEASFARDLLDRSSGVILLDEFDKAHEVFHSAFYELFDGGSYRDRNYALEVGPAIIICTSNYGSEVDVRNALGDALYSRFDLVVEFEHLGPDDLLVLVDRMVDDEVAQLSPAELASIDDLDLRIKLRVAALKATNVRKLRKLVAEVFSSELVRSILVSPVDTDQNATPAAGPEKDED